MLSRKGNLNYSVIWRSRKGLIWSYKKVKNLIYLLEKDKACKTKTHESVAVSLAYASQNHSNSLGLLQAKQSSAGLCRLTRFWNANEISQYLLLLKWSDSWD